MKHQQQLNSVSKKTKLKHIKKLAWGVLAGVMFGSIALTGTAFAGSLNANEEELMAIARGTFTYDGVTYRAKESYINEGYYYLIRDDVDVTAEQKQSAIAQVYASVKQGIDEGYLYPVSGGETSEPSQSTEPSQETENVGGETQGIETEVTKAETVNSNEEKETTIQETTDIHSGEETGGNLKDILEKEIEGTNKVEEVETTVLAPEIIALEELSDGEKNA